jgi:hypothetical protein
MEDPDRNYFVRYYGGDGSQQGVDMLPLADGSFLLLGNSSLGVSDASIYLVKVDAEGNILWEKTYDESDTIYHARDIEPAADGNFIILADFEARIGENTDMVLIKVDPEGTVIESTPFGTVANDHSKSVTVLDDGRIIVSGTTDLTSTYGIPDVPDPDLGDFFNYGFDQNLNKLSDSDWSPVFDGFGDHLDVAVKIVQGPAFFYIFGYSNSNLNNQNPNRTLCFGYFSRQIANGSRDRIFFPGSSLLFNDTEIQFVQPVAPELGGGFIIVGTSQTITGVSEIFLARMRATLTFAQPIWNDATLYYTLKLGRDIRGVSAASSVVGLPGFIVLGNEVRSTGASNIWVSKVDQTGSVLWSSTFGSEVEADTGAAVCELPDGKVVILGTMGIADSQSKMALIKLNPNGQLLK